MGKSDKILKKMQGNQVNGLINGYGKYTLSSGEVYYEGNWVNGEMSD